MEKWCQEVMRKGVKTGEFWWVFGKFIWVNRKKMEKIAKRESGWWFGTFFIFPHIGHNNPNWLIFFKRGWNHQPELVAKIIDIQRNPQRWNFQSTTNKHRKPMILRHQRSGTPLKSFGNRDFHSAPRHVSMDQLFKGMDIHKSIMNPSWIHH